MRSKTRDKVKRTLVAALLSSGLSESELQQFGDELASSNGSEFLFEFGNLLRTVIHQLRDQDQKPIMQPVKGKNLEELAYQTIQRRRLSKREVLQVIGEVIGSDKSHGPDSDHSLRDILRDFFIHASVDQAQKLLSRLQPPDSDAFLHGIMGRR
jgi:hypothetical protein